MIDCSNSEAGLHERVLVLAPIGRDARLACEVLEKEGFAGTACRNMDEFCEAIARGAGAAVISQESLTPTALDLLVRTLSKQPTWSDFPLIILTTADRRDSQFNALRPLVQTANFTLLERPLRIVTFLSAVNAALKARRRQYEIRDNLEMLRENEQRISTAVSAANMGSWRTNLTARISMKDASLNTMLGHGAVETNQPLDERFETIHPEDRATAVEAWQRAIESRGVYAAEFRLVRSDGSVQWLREQGRFVPGQNGSPDFITGVTVDISDRKRAEEALKQANRRKDEFLANISHEIRSPMTSILGYSDILLSNLKDPDDIECVRTIRESGNYLLEIINDILDLAKVEAGQMLLHEARLDPALVMQGCVRLIMPRAAKSNVRIYTAFEPHLPVLLADEARLRQIALNLLSNAVKFTKAGGRVTISTGVDPEGGITIAVTDTGIGMTAAEIAIALEPFQQVTSSLSRTNEGTGLGLPLTKTLVELHGGRLDIASAPGRGTTVTVTFPASRSLAQPVELAAQAG
jgi:PAS domain S-box-containing protein